MKKKIKILHVVSSYDNTEGGPPVSINNLAYAMRNSNKFKNSLISSVKKNNRLKKINLFNKVYIDKLFINKFYVPNIKMISNLIKSIKDNDIIHFHNFWNFVVFFGLFFSILLKKKIVLTPHGSFDNLNMKKSYFKKKIYLYLFGYIQLYFVDYFHFLGHQERKNSFFKKKNFFILFNFLKKISNIPKIKLRKNNINFCYLGRLDKIKNIKFQIFLIKYLNDNKVRSKLNIIGPDFGDKAILSKLVSRLKIRKQVKFINPIYDSRKYSWLKYSDFVLLTSNYECNSVLALETLASGGVLLTNKYTNLNHLKNYGAIEILSDDIRENCKKIINLYKNKKKLISIRKKSLEYTNKFNDKYFCNKISNFYSKLAKI